MYQRCLTCGRMVKRVNYWEVDCYSRHRVVRMADVEERCVAFVDVGLHPIPDVVDACVKALRWRVDEPVERVVSDVLYKHDVDGATAPRMVGIYLAFIRSEVREVL